MGKSWEKPGLAALRLWDIRYQWISMDLMGFHMKQVLGLEPPCDLTVFKTAARDHSREGDGSKMGGAAS